MYATFITRLFANWFNYLVTSHALRRTIMQSRKLAPSPRAERPLEGCCAQAAKLRNSPRFLCNFSDPDRRTEREVIALRERGSIYMEQMCKYCEFGRVIGFRWEFNSWTRSKRVQKRAFLSIIRFDITLLHMYVEKRNYERAYFFSVSSPRKCNMS